MEPSDNKGSESTPPSGQPDPLRPAGADPLTPGGANPQPDPFPSGAAGLPPEPNIPPASSFGASADLPPSGYSSSSSLPPNDPLPPLGSVPPPAPGSVPAGSPERQWAMFAHLSGLLVLTSTPILNALGPLIIWQVKKDTMPFVNDQGKEALNFQITHAIVLAVLWVIGFATCGIGFFLVIPEIIFVAVMAIIGGLKANDGVAYRYPLCWRLIT